MPHHVLCHLYAVQAMSTGSEAIICLSRRNSVGNIGESIDADLATNGLHYYHQCWRHAADSVLYPRLRENLSPTDYLMELFSNDKLKYLHKSIH